MMATGSVHEDGAMKTSTFANFRIALTTPIKAPPAMKPDAMRVPFSIRASLTVWSLLRVLTNHETAPPTRRGRLSSSGMNIPRQNARAGTPHQFKTRAITAPMA